MYQRYEVRSGWLLLNVVHCTAEATVCQEPCEKLYPYVPCVVDKILKEHIIKQWQYHMNRDKDATQGFLYGEMLFYG
jgi:hypothetical protein